MPLYEYQCRDCSAEFEKLVPMSQADNPAECPECGGKRTRRLLSKIGMAVSPARAGKSTSAAPRGAFT